LEKALQLDPQNFFVLQQVSLSYEALRNYSRMAELLDHAVALVPDDVDSRVTRARVDLESRANSRALHQTITDIVNKNPADAARLADTWLYLALCERDPAAASDAVAALPSSGLQNDAVVFSRKFCEGLAARARNDLRTARGAFTAARPEYERTVRAQPDYGPPLCVLGMIDAALGRNDEAIREGQRAVELLPVSKDALNGAQLSKCLAVIYAWTGEKDRAIDQIAATLQVPGDLSYGQLKLHLYWDPLRGDPRFEKIVASLAPKETTAK
jgi:tetratricopeptide (TPR) repeat protein